MVKAGLDGEEDESDGNVECSDPEDLVEEELDPATSAAKPANIPDKGGAPVVKAEYVALNPFKDLYKLSPVIQMAFEFGQAIIPLSAVGMILNYTGNHLLHYIGTVMHKKVFYPMTKITNVHLMPNGDIVSQATRKKFEIQ